MFAIVSFLVKMMGMGVVKRSPNKRCPSEGAGNTTVGKTTCTPWIGSLCSFCSAVPSYLHSHAKRGL